MKYRRSQRTDRKLLPIVVAVCTIMLLAGAGCDLSVVNIGGDDFDPGGRVVDRPSEEQGQEALNPNFQTSESCSARDVDPGPAVVRRLTNLEYLNTLHDVFGVDAYDLAARLPEESRVEGFHNAARGLTASGPLIDQYRQIARRVASRLEGGSWLDRFQECSVGDRSCERRFVSEYGQLLFRRDLEHSELERYGRLFRVVEAEGDGFERGARLVVEAMLQSPHFLYRLESQTTGAAVERRVIPASEFEVGGLVGEVGDSLSKPTSAELVSSHPFEPGEYRVTIVASGKGKSLSLEIGEMTERWTLDSDVAVPVTVTFDREESAELDVTLSLQRDGGGFAEVEQVDIVGPLDTSPSAGEVTGHDGVRPVTDVEMASRLSYFVWHSAPDRELLEKAESGQLHTEEQLRAQVQRMIQDPRARRAFRSYVAEWLHLDYLETAERDAELYPAFDRELVAEMKAETLALFEHVAWDAEADMTTVFTADKTWVGPKLAELYGLPQKDGGTSEYDLSDDLRRGGLLTQAGLLTVTTPNDVTSPVRRGLFVRTHLMCQPVAPPPPDLVTAAPEIDTTAPKRKLFEQHSRNEQCAKCHSKMDPIGFGFEHYDAIGGWREKDLSGTEVVTMSYLQNGERITHFDGPTELAEILSESRAVENCMVQKVYQFATGRPPDSGDACDLRQVRETFRAEGRTYPALLEAVVLSDAFRHVRVHEPDTAEEDGS